MSDYTFKENDVLGKVISGVDNNRDYIRFTFTDGTTLTGTAEGDCCACAYITDFEEDSGIIGSSLVETDSEGVDSPEDDEYGNVHDIACYTIKTTKGRITFNLHVEHNGYYGGRVNWSVP